MNVWEEQIHWGICFIYMNECRFKFHSIIFGLRHDVIVLLLSMLDDIVISMSTLWSNEVHGAIQKDKWVRPSGAGVISHHSDVGTATRAPKALTHTHTHIHQGVHRLLSSDLTRWTLSIALTVVDMVDKRATECFNHR